MVGSKTTAPGDSGHDLSACGFYHRVLFSFDAIVYHRQGLGSHKGQVRTVQYPARGKKPPQMIIDFAGSKGCHRRLFPVVCWHTTNPGGNGRPFF